VKIPYLTCALGPAIQEESLPIIVSSVVHGTRQPLDCCNTQHKAS